MVASFGVTVCGAESLLVKVTRVPFLTVSGEGAKAKLTMFTVTGAGVRGRSVVGAGVTGVTGATGVGAIGVVDVPF